MAKRTPHCPGNPAIDGEATDKVMQFENVELVDFGRKKGNRVGFVDVYVCDFLQIAHSTCDTRPGGRSREGRAVSAGGGWATF